jgi:hypothetical protein
MRQRVFILYAHQLEESNKKDLHALLKRGYTIASTQPMGTTGSAAGSCAYSLVILNIPEGVDGWSE